MGVVCRICVYMEKVFVSGATIRDMEIYQSGQLWAVNNVIDDLEKEHQIAGYPSLRQFHQSSPFVEIFIV